MSGSRTLKVVILGDASGAQRAMADTEASAGGLLAKFEGVGAGIGKLGGLLQGALAGVGFAAVQAGMAGVSAAFAGVKNSVINTNAELEQSTVSWGVLLGSTDKAQAKLADLSKFAAQTPFDFPGVQKASLLLQTFGGDALNTTKTLTLVGDVAAGVNQPFEDVAMWTGRMYSAMKNGQPFGEAAARLQEMGAMSGETRLKLEQMQKSGASSEHLWAAFSDSMGRFGGMMEKQSKTFVGQMSTMQDSLNMLAAQAGKPIFDLLTAGLGKVNALLSSDAVTHGVERFAAGLQSGIGAVGDFGRYLRAVADDGDSLNDWLTHLPARVRPLVQAFGVLTATARQVGAILTRRDFVGGGWLAEDSPLVTGLFALLRAFDLGRDAAQTFREALRGDWFGGQTQSINGFVRTIGRGVQLARDAFLTLRQALSGKWTAGGAGNDFVNMIGRIGLGLRAIWEAVRPLLPQFLAIGRALGVVLSPVWSFVKALIGAGGDVRGALNSMRTTLTTGLAALGTVLKALGPPLARALWGFLGDAAGAFKEWWQRNDINGKLRRFLGEQLPKLAGGALDLGKRLWAGLGDLAARFAEWWRDNGVTQKITDRISRFLGGLGDLGAAIWAGLGDLAGKFADWWRDNGMTQKVKDKLGELLGKLGEGASDLGKAIWAGLGDLAAKFQTWWTENGMTEKVRAKAEELLGNLGDFAGNLWAGLGDLAGKFKKWWDENKKGDELRAKVEELLGNLGEFAGNLWTGLGDLVGKFKKWWDDNKIGDQIWAAIGAGLAAVNGAGIKLEKWLDSSGLDAAADTWLAELLKAIGRAILGKATELNGIFVKPVADTGTAAGSAYMDNMIAGVGLKSPKFAAAFSGLAGLIGQILGRSFENAFNGAMKNMVVGFAQFMNDIASSPIGRVMFPNVLQFDIAGLRAELEKRNPVLPLITPEDIARLTGVFAPDPPSGGGGGAGGGYTTSTAPAGGTQMLAFGAGGAGGGGGAVTIQNLTFAPVINGMTYPEAGQRLADDFLAALKAATQGGQILPATGGYVS